MKVPISRTLVAWAAKTSSLEEPALLAADHHPPGGEVLPGRGLHRLEVGRGRRGVRLGVGSTARRESMQLVAHAPPWSAHAGRRPRRRAPGEPAGLSPRSARRAGAGRPCRRCRRRRTGTVTSTSGAPFSSACCSASRRATTPKLRKLSATSPSTRAATTGSSVSPSASSAVRPRHGLGQLVGAGVAQVLGQHLVEDDRAEVQLARRQLVREELGLAHGRGLEGGDDHEGGAPVREQPRHRLGPLDEPGVHRLEQDEELRDVGQELGAEDPVGHLVEGLGGHVHQARAVGHDQPAQQARREEVGHALRGVEEVERVAGRRACPPR